MPVSDTDLIAACAAGDRGAYGQFVRRYTAALFRYCYGRLGDRQLAEDSVQEAFLRVFRQVAGGREPDDPAAWLFAVARRCCQEIQRQTRQYASPSPEHAAQPVSDNPTAGADSREEVEEMLARLNDTEQSLIYLKHFEGLSCRQIVERTGKPLGTVTSTLTRVYRKLRASQPAGRRPSSRR